MRTYNVSVIIPTRNEEKILRKNINKIEQFLKNSKKIDKYELLICDYSEDRTPDIAKDMQNTNPNIRYIGAEKRGIGEGILCGLQNASLDYTVLYSIDLSWNLESIEDTLENLEDSDITLASREHKESKCTRPKKRIIFSKMYNFLINLFFNLNINDTQCNLAAKTKDIRSYIDRLDSSSAFLQTQIIIYGKQNNLRIKEVPSIVTDIRSDSKINVIKDGTRMFKEIITEKKKLRSKK